MTRPHEILEELAPYFTVAHRRFFPFVPVMWCNLVIGLTLKPRPHAQNTLPLAA